MQGCGEEGGLLGWRLMEGFYAHANEFRMYNHCKLQVVPMIVQATVEFCLDTDGEQEFLEDGSFNTLAY